MGGRENITDYAWAMFHLSQGRKVRRRSWPIGWRIWRAFPDADQRFDTIISGWGGQMGAFDAEHVQYIATDGAMWLLGTDGSGWTPYDHDKTATDWELL